MKVYTVWDNDDYGSTFSPDQDYITAIYERRTDAEAAVTNLNKDKKKWQTKARLQEWTVK